jgi:hypothetical protein
MGALAVPLQVTINIGKLPMGLGTATMLARYLLIMEVSEMYMRAFAPYTFAPWFRFGEGNKAEGLSRFLAAVAAPTGLRALDEELRCRLNRFRNGILSIPPWAPIEERRERLVSLEKELHAVSHAAAQLTALIRTMNCPGSWADRQVHHDGPSLCEYPESELSDTAAFEAMVTNHFLGLCVQCFFACGDKHRLMFQEKWVLRPDSQRCKVWSRSA